MTRDAILDKAKLCVCGGRDTDYGEPEYSFRLIAELWTTYYRAVSGECVKFCEKDVAMFLALVKVARIAYGNTPDSYVDMAGYAACAGEIDGGGERVDEGGNKSVDSVPEIW